MLNLALRGFTLAEVLVALLILGQIAAFTIPKILAAQQNGRHNAIVKEAAAAVAAAYKQHQIQGLATTSTRVSHLTSYLNFIAVDTTSTVDYFHNTSDTRSCSSWSCLRLHSGAIMRYGPNAFGTTGGVLWFAIDPDGRVTDGTTNGPGKTIQFQLSYNGRLTTYGVQASNPDLDPPWFSW